MPPRSRKLDYEAAIGAVIGMPARDVPVTAVEEALQYVAGYSCLNDLSARDLVTQEDRHGTRMHADWVSHKCFDDALPIGPWITQDSNSKHMIHSIAEQISALSRQITLMPGDVIATGTPAGMGAGRGEQGEFLKCGDVVEIEVQHIGRLVNRMQASVSPYAEP